jgi:hypothetical protein
VAAEGRARVPGRGLYWRDPEPVRPAGADAGAVATERTEEPMTNGKATHATMKVRLRLIPSFLDGCGTQTYHTLFPQGGLADEGSPDPLDLDGARPARAVSRRACICVSGERERS